METLSLTESGPSAKSGQLKVPVLDGTLAEYSSMVPTAVPTKSK